VLTGTVLMVGLTGGIGSGKSMVARRLVEHGAVLIDADRLAREVVQPGTDGLRAVVDAFGADLLTPDGALDRAALGSRVFGDEPARRRLESIIHPRVRARSRELTEAAPPDAIVVNDVPLLVEAGLPTSYHLVLVVEASESTRVARLREYRGMGEADAYARIRAQATDEQRRAAADVLLVNESTVEDLLARVDQVWHERLVPYEENVRLRRPVRPAERLALRPYDPTWPTQYARLAVRVAHAAESSSAAPSRPRPLAGRVDHVGSTAVPGLPARDVIDIQLTVDTLADADLIADALAEAGFPRAEGVRYDASAPDAPEADAPEPEAPDAPEPEPKRLHASADPGRVVHLHVRAAGSPGWRAALLLRDWLRADPVACREYAAVKERLVGDGLSSVEYARAKQRWVDQAWPRARRWAETTGWHPGPASSPGAGAQPGAGA
jgi:dephospho-CoA kinase